MEAVELDTLRAIADSLAADAKSLERKARHVKQQAAAVRDNVIELQSKEDTSEHQQHSHNRN